MLYDSNYNIIIIIKIKDLLIKILNFETYKIIIIFTNIL